MKVDTVLIAVGVAAGAALAQAPGPPVVAEPLAAPALQAPIPWAAMVCSLVAAVAICILGFKSSHRTHLD